MTDNELIYLVKEKQDSKALIELTHRHTGLFMSVVGEYSHRINIKDITDGKLSHIYDCAVSYDPDRGMKFSSYLYDMTRYTCLNMANTKHRTEEITDSIPEEGPDPEYRTEKKDIFEAIKRRAGKIDDPRFFEILKARFLDGKLRPWREVEKITGLSHEGARKLFNRHIKKITSYVKK